MPTEQRTARRKFMTAPAVLCNDAGAVVVACEVLDVSETGIRICLAKPTPVAGKVRLVLSKDGAVRRRCRVIWQEGRFVGLQFDKRYSGRSTPREVAWV